MRQKNGAADAGSHVHIVCRGKTNTVMASLWESTIALTHGNVGFLVVAIIGISYLLEDVAVVGAAVLASQHQMPWPLALFATITGLISGDVLLYGFGYWLGRSAANDSALERWPRWQRALRHVRHAHWGHLVLLRFTPGLRTAGFGACGIARMRLQRFVVIDTLGVCLWCALVFGIIAAAGAVATHWLVSARWPLLIVAVLLALLLHQYLNTGKPHL